MKFPTFLLLAVASGGLASAAPDAATPGRTPIARGESHATSFAPLAYFNRNCARCHGENGSFYGADFAKDRDDASLRAVIDEMASGPAQAPLSPAELDAVAAWHRALRDKKPFLILVGREKTAEGWKLSGEVSPGATLQINGESVEVEGTNWTFVTAQAALKLRATAGEATTELDVDAASWAPQ